MMQQAAPLLYNSPYSYQNQMTMPVPQTQVIFPNMGMSRKESSPQAKRQLKRPISAVNKGKATLEEFERQLAQPYIAGGQKKSHVSTNDFMNSTYRKKLIPASMMYQKEDLYDDNIHLKLQLNNYKDDNIRLRTRIAQLMANLRNRDKLFDDLYKSAFITSAGTPAKNNLNKDVLLMINLKREVSDLKDIIYQKEAEILDLKKDIKSTKIKELEIDLRTYMQECSRLRKIAEHSIRLSGEIDLKRM